jgi:DNA-directed RNA polymerase specialized sigma24 family protein
MRYIEGVPAETVAERMNRTPSAVAMTSRRALEALRRALGRSSRYLSR